MKTLEEKKLLLQMMRAFGQDDKELAESIKKEEQLAAVFFKQKPKVESAPIVTPKPVIIKEPEPEPQIISVIEQPVQPEPAPAFVPPTSNTIQAVINVLATANTANANTNIYRDKEVRGFVGVTDREMSTRLRAIERETDEKLRNLEKKVDDKIQKAWENPLAN